MAPERGVVGALIRFELPRLVRRPSVIVGLLATVVAIWLAYRTVAPVLDRDSPGLVSQFLPLAGAMLIAMHGVGRRPRRGNVGELLAAVPTRSARRVVGEALAMVGPVLAGIVVLGAAMLFLVVGEPTGGWQWIELMGMPALLLLCGGIGLALGQWLPGRATPIVTVIGLAYAQAWASSDAESFAGRWLSAIAPVQLVDRYEPYVWQARSPGAHLAWLLALATLAAIVAVLRWDRRGSVVTAGAIVAVIAVAAGSASLRAAQVDQPFDERNIEAIGERSSDAGSSAEADADSERFVVCEEHEDLTLCALPGYERWIPRWHETVTRVTDIVPAPVTRVTQQPWNVSFIGDEGDAIVTGMSWDRPGVGTRETFELSVGVGMQAVLPPGARGTHCWLGGEARSSIGLWLAVQGDDALVAELQRRVDTARNSETLLVEDDGTQQVLEFAPLWLGLQALNFDVGVVEGDLALEMAALPFATVEEVVLADLDRWQDPDVGVVELAAALDLPAPDQLDHDAIQDFWESPGCG